MLYWIGALARCKTLICTYLEKNIFGSETLNLIHDGEKNFSG
jgi:hypothetical protein